MNKSLLAGLGVGSGLVLFGLVGSVVLFPPRPEPVDLAPESAVPTAEPGALEAITPDPDAQPVPVEPMPELDEAPPAEAAPEEDPAEPEALEPGDLPDTPEAAPQDDAVAPPADPAPLTDTDAQESAAAPDAEALPDLPEEDPAPARTRLPSGLIPTPAGEARLALPQVLPPVPEPSSTEAPAAAVPPEDALGDAPGLRDDPEPTLPGTRISGLPQIRGADLPPEGLDNVLPPNEAVLGALERNSLYAGTGASARMSVILADPGLPEALRAEVAAIGLPLTIALNPLDSSAPEAAALYREAGMEIVILATSIPDGATASDIDVTFSAFFDAVPEAVAVIDLPETGFARNIRMLDEVLPLIAQDGHGLLTFSGGLAQAGRAARAAGIAHAEVFRSLDAGGESAFTIRRFLDRAVFQASQTGHVIVFGDAANEETLEAIDMWQEGAGLAQVALVPVSGILRAEQ